MDNLCLKTHLTRSICMKYTHGKQKKNVFLYFLFFFDNNNNNNTHENIKKNTKGFLINMKRNRTMKKIKYNVILPSIISHVDALFRM